MVLFLLVFGKKIFRRTLPYLHAVKVSDLGHPLTPPISVKHEKPQGTTPNLLGGCNIGCSFFIYCQKVKKKYLKLNLIHILLEKMDADFMDSAMNNERLNMGVVVGETMEPFPIQFSHWLVKPFNLTYLGCLYLKK